MERIDVHCHAVPPGYRQYALDNGHEKPDGMPALPVSQLLVPGFSLTSPGLECRGAHCPHEEAEYQQVNFKHHISRNTPDPQP